jgi:hypothetical protein
LTRRVESLSAPISIYERTAVKSNTPPRIRHAESSATFDSSMRLYSVDDLRAAQRHARLRIQALAAIVVWVHAGHSFAGASLPRDPSQLLLIGDSVTAGVYFLSLDETSIRQSWSGQLLGRLGIDPPRAPYPQAYPINHLGLAQRSLAGSGLTYLWDARHALTSSGPRYQADEERVVMAVPAQTVHEVLTQSSLTKMENAHSCGRSGTSSSRVFR